MRPKNPYKSNIMPKSSCIYQEHEKLTQIVKYIAQKVTIENTNVSIMRINLPNKLLPPGKIPNAKELSGESYPTLQNHGSKSIPIPRIGIIHNIGCE